MTATQWKNWSGGMACAPSEIVQPDSEDGIVTAVRSAIARGGHLRMFGTGHSSMPLVATNDVLMNLDNWQGVESHDTSTKRAWIRAGTKIHRLGEELFPRGLAMENMGDVDVQAIAGAVGTGTHGTGPSMGNISSRVTAVQLVDGAGEVVRIDERDMATLLAARVAVGSLGVFTHVELQLMDAYRLEERTWRVAAEAGMASLDEAIAATRHFEFFWFPQPDVCEMKSLNPTDDPVDDDSGREGAGDLSAPPGRRCGWSHRIIPHERTYKFHEMEYAVPAEAGPDCFALVRERMRSRWTDVQWPVEYRTLQADDAWLSPAHGRATVTISVHQDARLPYEDFFGDLEPIFKDHAGRSHWGKLNTLSAVEMAARYPKWEDFRAVRKRFDPAGVFLNDYLRELFEPGTAAR